MKVIKRNNNEVDYNIDNVIKAIYNAALDVTGDEEEAQAIAEQIASVTNLRIVEKYNRPSVEEIQDIIEQTLMDFKHYDVAKAFIIYRQKQTLERDGAWIEGDLSESIWENKYRYKNETHNEFLNRVSDGDTEIAKLIRSKHFCPAGRILANRGLQRDGKKITYSNCYLIEPVKDNLESIFDTAYKLARTFSYGGGCGIDISLLRFQGAKVNNAAKTTSGVCSFMELFDVTSKIIGQSGRRAALIITLICTHPNIEEFIDIKNDLNAVTKANISIRMTDEFMKAVKKNKDFELSFHVNDTGEHITKTVSAHKIFNKIALSNWNMAEPGILYWSQINRWNLLSEDPTFEYAGVNPCLTGDTLIATADGRNAVSIKYLEDTQFPVYSARIKNSNNCRGYWKAEIKNARAFSTGTKDIIEITLSDNSSFRCTPDHMLALPNGTYIEAQNSLGHELEKIYTFSNKNTNKSYRMINSKSNGFARQYKMIWEFHNDKYDGKIHNINHKDNDSTNDSLSNLELLSVEEHKNITKRFGSDNPIQKIKGSKYLSLYCQRSNIQANATRYNWNSERLNKSLDEWDDKHADELQQHKPSDINVYLDDRIYVKDIKKMGKEKVYDLTVEDNHNFYIITKTDDENYLNSSGILVHNCGELVLPSGGACNLSSINLSEFVVNPFEDNAYFDFDLFNEVVKKGVAFLNEILDEGLRLHPLHEQRESVKQWRQIGLGIFGLADMLIKMKMKYAGPESLKVIDEIGSNMINSALQQSALLAAKDGPYPRYHSEDILKSKFLKANATSKTLKLIMQHGLRNSQLLTAPPTGTISNLLNSSSGIEPIFALSYKRLTKTLHDEDKEYEVFTPIVREYMNKYGIDDISELPDYFITSHDIHYKDRINLQSTLQKYIDASISSTINLPNSATVTDIKDLYMYAWEKQLKGVTLYRDGCARTGILTTGKKKEEKKEMTHEDFIEQGICPECKGQINHTGGCIECPACGFSACSA